jgi:hypothetical protein
VVYRLISFTMRIGIKNGGRKLIGWTLWLLWCVIGTCYGAPRTNKIDAADGQKVQKEFYPNGILKTVTRLYPDGRVLGRAYYTTNGVATHFDYYDEKNRVRRTLLYRPDGTAHTSREFDEQHRLVTETRLDPKGEEIERIFHLSQGGILLRAPGSWQVITQKLDGSQDVVGLRIPNPADLGTSDSANIVAISYDLSQSTNRTAFAEVKNTSASRGQKPSRFGEWSIHTFHEKQGATRYEIRDAHRGMGERYGLYVRLAFPDLPKTTQQWRQALERDFKTFLDVSEREQGR